MIVGRIGPAIVLASFVGVTMLVVFGACGNSNDGLEPNPLATSYPRRDSGGGADDDVDASAPEDAAGPSAEASAAAKTYKGTLGETLPVKFGGSPYCSYTMKFKPITIEVAALESGEVISATVKNTAIEATVPPCPHNPSGPSAQSFSLKTATPKGTAGDVTLTFVGAKTNTPQTTLVVDLVKSGASYEASGVWQRTDQPKPLDWQVKAKLTLVTGL